MRKKIIQILLLTALFSACRKDSNQQPGTKIRTNIMTLYEVKSWYGQKAGSSLVHEQYHSAAPAKSFDLHGLAFDWDKAENVNGVKSNWWYVHLDGQPAYKNVKQGYRKLAFVKDSTGAIAARILEILPDALYIQRNQNASTKNFTGRVFIYDEHYQFLRGYVYGNGKIGGHIIPASNVNANLRANPYIQNNSKPTAGSSDNQHSTSAMHRELQITQDCEWYQDVYIDGDGTATVYAEQDCSYTIGGGGESDDFGGSGAPTGDGDYLGKGGGGGGTAATAPAVSNLPNEDDPTVNPQSYINCFSGIPDAGATMTVTVYVVQPWPGTSFDVGPNSVGHTAIGLTKSNHGATITQVLGFYPNASGLSKIHAPSKIEDNGGDLDYNESVSYTVSAQQFGQILSYISNPPAVYDLTIFNCTNFVAAACNAGGITLPDANGIVGFNGAALTPAYGLTPAALGSSISNMSGTNVNKNGGTTPNSHGPCN